MLRIEKYNCVSKFKKHLKVTLQIRNYERKEFHAAGDILSNLKVKLSYPLGNTQCFLYNIYVTYIFLL